MTFKIIITMAALFLAVSSVAWPGVGDSYRGLDQEMIRK